MVENDGTSKPGESGAKPEAKKDEGVDYANLPTKLKVFGWVLLAYGVIGGSLIGSLSSFLPHTEFMLTNVWRNGCGVVMFLIPAIIQTVQVRKKNADPKTPEHEKIGWRQLFGLRITFGLLLSQFFCLFWAFGIFYGTSVMVQMHAYVFTTMNGVFYLIILYILCTKPICTEVIGCVLAIAGGICMYFDESAVKTDGVEATFLDYMITLSGSLAGALYFFVSNRFISNIPLGILFWIMSVYGFILALILSKIMNDQVMVFSFDPNWGCFGFLNREWVGYCLFVWFFGAMYPGYFAFIQVMLYLPP